MRRPSAIRQTTSNEVTRWAPLMIVETLPGVSWQADAMRFWERPPHFLIKVKTAAKSCSVSAARTSALSSTSGASRPGVVASMG